MAGVRARVAAGRLHRIYKGVYAVGHARVEKRGRMLAAVLTCPEGTALSHRSAAELHGLRRWYGYPELSVPRESVRARPELILHCCRSFPPDNLTAIEGIPVTDPHRTLVDLCDVLPKKAVGKALTRAEELRLLDIRRLSPDLHPGRKTRLVTELLHEWDPRYTRTRTELENMFIDLCKRARLPLPAVNVWLTHPPIEVDFLWEEARVIVETDGFETHGTRRAFEEDRRRDQLTTAAGYRTLRCTWRQVERRDPELIAALRKLL